MFDPNGVLIELTFEATVEGIAEPPSPRGKELDPRDRSWFDPTLYRVFDEVAQAA